MPDVVQTNRPTAAAPIKFSKAQIEDLAERLARESGYIEHQDINRVVESFGGKIEITDFWENEATGSLYVKREGDFTVRIPNHTTRERDRFTIAHELGHYILHYLLAGRNEAPEPMVADRYGSGLVEWQANWFAASFLMPAREFMNQFGNQSDLFGLARSFNVSTSAANIRAKALGLID